MTMISTSLIAGALVASLVQPAAAQTLGPVLSQDRAITFNSDGQVTSYMLGTRNAKELLKGARRVPRNTLFFMGANGELYMRNGPFLEDDGTFRFGPDKS